MIKVEGEAPEGIIIPSQAMIPAYVERAEGAAKKAEEIANNVEQLTGVKGVASQVEAEVGVVDDKIMTPLRVKQAIDVSNKALGKIYSVRGQQPLQKGQYTTICSMPIEADGVYIISANCGLTASVEGIMNLELAVNNSVVESARTTSAYGGGINVSHLTELKKGRVIIVRSYGYLQEQITAKALLQLVRLA